jgi:hypothetical protein
MKKIHYICCLLMSSVAIQAQQTFTRNDAGLQGNAGAQSGFFETVSPVNYPAGASSWWHLLDIRHTNTLNNYAMQIAGSFFDQDLYFRKTNGSATTAWNKILYTSPQGNAGIGIAPDAAARLYVYQGAGLAAAAGSRQFISKFAGASGNYCELSTSLYRFAAGGDWLTTATRLQARTDVTDQAYIDFNPAGAPFGLALGTAGNGAALTVNGSSQVIIGNTPAPAGYRLFVEQGILTEKVKVAVKTSGNWADHVFKNGYQLKPLKEVAAFIRKNNHLPGVPSAETLVKDGGVDVGSMLAKQMEKIEELTLYIINMDKEVAKIKQLENDNRQLRRKIARLENKQP